MKRQWTETQKNSSVNRNQTFVRFRRPTLQLQPLPSFPASRLIAIFTVFSQRCGLSVGTSLCSHPSVSANIGRHSVAAREPNMLHPIGRICQGLPRTDLPSFHLNCIACSVLPSRPYPCGIFPGKIRANPTYVEVVSA